MVITTTPELAKLQRKEFDKLQAIAEIQKEISRLQAEDEKRGDRLEKAIQDQDVASIKSINKEKTNENIIKGLLRTIEISKAKRVCTDEEALEAWEADKIALDKAIEEANAELEKKVTELEEAYTKAYACAFNRIGIHDKYKEFTRQPLRQTQYKQYHEYVSRNPQHFINVAQKEYHGAKRELMQ